MANVGGICAKHAARKLEFDLEFSCCYFEDSETVFFALYNDFNAYVMYVSNT